MTDSIGGFFVLTGLALCQGFSTNLVRILIVLALLYLLNPVITHATVRAALRAGLKPWTREQQLSANGVDGMAGVESVGHSQVGASLANEVGTVSSRAAREPMENIENP
jgi:hypothetical protein